MSYCRFQNTRNDLIDCQRHINDNLDDSSDERRARQTLIETCAAILESVGYEVNEPDDDETDCVPNEERVFGYAEKRTTIGDTPDND